MVEYSSSSIHPHSTSVLALRATQARVHWPTVRSVILPNAAEMGEARVFSSGGIAARLPALSEQERAVTGMC